MQTPVCANCFEDEDIATAIREADGEPGCEFCGNEDAPTIHLGDLGEFLVGRICQEYGTAVDQLPYDGREGGFQGWHADSYDLIFDQGIIALARHSDELLEGLVEAIGSTVIWADYDWLSLNPDLAMKYSWEAFTRVVKHERHFFFYRFPAADWQDPDHLDPLALMGGIASLCQTLGLVRSVDAGAIFYRARPRDAEKQWTTVADLGPPPPEQATQFNRMNPPGVPVMYVSETPELSTAEIKNSLASIGTWKTHREARILDLANLPPYPGLFSPLDRAERLGLRFLLAFVKTITQPAAGNDLVKLDYIPTQVLTEFLRDFAFKGGRIDGIRYPSATEYGGANIVLFATQDALQTIAPNSPVSVGEPWLSLEAVSHIG